MYQGNELQFEMMRLRERIMEVLGDVQGRNGIFLAHALISALEVDLRVSAANDGVTRLLELTDEQIDDLAAQLEWSLENGGASFKLPLGTIVDEDDGYAVRIGRESWVHDVARPGLHPVAMVRRDAHGPNLQLLRERISRLTKRLACRRIGLPSAAFIVDNDSRHLLQFPALLEASGVVLQRRTSDSGAVRFCSASADQIEAFAASIVADMRVLWKRRKAIGARAALIRIEAQKAAEAQVGVGIRSIAIDLEFQREDKDFCFYVEYDAIDEAMRPGIVLDYIPVRGEGERMWHPAPYGICGRHEDRGDLHARGADGEIDGMALAVLRAGPEKPVAILERLSRSYETQVTFTTHAGPLYATLYWRDGCVRAEVTIPGKMEWYGNHLAMYDYATPKYQIEESKGCRISDVVELPFQCDGKIVDAHEPNKRELSLTLEMERFLINCGTARIWNDDARRLADMSRDPVNSLDVPARTKPNLRIV